MSGFQPNSNTPIIILNNTTNASKRWECSEIAHCIRRVVKTNYLRTLPSAWKSKYIEKQSPQFPFRWTTHIRLHIRNHISVFTYCWHTSDTTICNCVFYAENALHTHAPAHHLKHSPKVLPDKCRKPSRKVTGRDARPHRMAIMWPSRRDQYPRRCTSILAGLHVGCILLLLQLLLARDSHASTQQLYRNARLSTRIVQTRYGRLQGLVLPLDNFKYLRPVEAHLGVPYATPPTKSNRFVMLADCVMRLNHKDFHRHYII